MMSEEKQNRKTVGSALVIGGGIAGMQAALDLAEVGIKVYLVEANSAIGGFMTQLDKTFPTNECAMCVVSPKLVECARHINIEIIPDAEIESLEGEAGNFKVRLYKKSRFVDMQKCTGCEECVRVCPVEVPNDFNHKLSRRKAIYRLYPQAVPRTFVIDKAQRPPCVVKCPAQINVQGYTALISQGKYQQAFELIKQRAPFPGVLGRVCYHPCEEACNRKEIEEPLAINPLKRFVCDFVYENKNSSIFTDKVEAKEEKVAPREFPYSFDLSVNEELVKERKGKKVAVVGAGPCGLTCAYDLSRLGYAVTIFEAQKILGGMMAQGIPSYRLPRKILQLEIENILKCGIEVKTGVSLGKDFRISDLQKEGFAAVLLATGANKGKDLSFAGSNFKGVWQGVDFLKKVNFGEELTIKGKVLVIGGGNVAIDVARSSLRQGASQAHIVCLEPKEQMPAHSWEIELAEQEGVIIHTALGPKEILGQDNKITGVKFLKCLRVFDAAGKFNPIFNQREECVIEANQVIFAIGQQPDTSYLGIEETIEKTAFGTIKVDGLTYETAQNGVFAAGDVTSGPASVVAAIGSAKEAVISLDRYIRKQDLKIGRSREKESSPRPEMEFKRQRRAKVPLLSQKERRNNFKEVELTLSEEEAIQEAKRCMNCGICSECLECEKVCEPCAINHNLPDERVEINTGAVIVACGGKLFDVSLKKEYGYARYDNVITSIQFERILSSSGPSAGEVLRPTDARAPKKIAFIQCVGSRTSVCGNEFCSSVCCMYSIKEAMVAKEHDCEIEATIFYIDVRSFGKDFERYYEEAKKNYGIKFVRCMVSKIYEKPKSKNLMVKYIDAAGKFEEAEFDLVVLAAGLTPSLQHKSLAQNLGIELNDYGFAKTNRLKPGLTSKPGIFVAGLYAEPKDIPETVIEASSSASLASALLKEVRGSLVKKKEYPLERDVQDELPRIGVFICRCGKNIASVIDVSSVVEYASKLERVAYAGEFLYTCSKDALDGIKQKIREYNLNRVVIAACTPRTHEELFRDTVREAGLNRYLFEMTSLREQVSWVHRALPKVATQKSKDLVAMMAAKAALLKPLERKFSEVTAKALVIGGGASGMQAALSTAQQGFEVYLIEKENNLGGQMLELYDNLGETDPQVFLKTLIKDVSAHEKIHLFTNTCLKSISGFVGNYRSLIDCSGREREIEHGVVIVATGAKAYEPKIGEYGYLKLPRIITQVKLEEKLTKSAQDFSLAQRFVMIQCVGSRNDEHPYCSRVCCTHSIKNALKLKAINPGHEIIILYRDMRTYGFLEKYYLKAREAGVIFSGFEQDTLPQVEIEGNQITVKQKDRLLREEIVFKPDWLILSTAIVPADNQELAKILKVSLNNDGFFLEAHPKIRPLDFATEGMFFCGLAHSPRFLSESLSLAKASSVRAVSILSKDKIEAKAITVSVNERLCRGCGLCVSVCPYKAREIDEETKTAKVIEVLCQGCGACSVACPSQATTHKGFSKKQIMAMVEKAV